jgi:hypothetical protein
MGNQPSTPTNDPTSAPQLPPVCGSECQRQKKLSALKLNLDAKTATKNTDPVGYEQARIAYFTELNGQGWLATEKERIAKDEIEPILSDYQTRYKNLKDDTKNQGVFVNLMNMLKADESKNQDDIDFLSKKEQAEKDKADVLNRLNQLQDSTSAPSQSYLPIIVDVAIVLLAIFIIYTAYRKFTTSPSSTVMTAGKRLLHNLIR